MKDIKTKNIIFVIALVTLLAPMAIAENLTENATVEKFKVEPMVALKPLNNVINSSSDIFLVLYMANPSNNDVDLNVDLNAKSIPGIRIYGQEFSTTNIGDIAGTFNVTPGKTKIVRITLKAEKAGDFMIQFSGMYWPGNNKNDYRPMSLDFKFRAEEASSNPEESGQLNRGGPIPSVTPNITAVPKKIPELSIGLAILLIAALYIYKKRK